MELSDAVKNFIRGGMPVVSNMIDGFPYPMQYCPYCERDCILQAAFHVIDEEHHFKAVYVCDNTNCGAFDEDAKSAYVKVYYSSQESYEKLEGTLLRVPRETKH